MAPAANLPDIDMSQIQAADIQQSYWLLFDKMKDDFVHKKDLELMLKAATVNGGVQENTAGPIVVLGARVYAPAIDTVAQVLAKTYSKLAKTGGIVREQVIEGLETLTS
jgi:hypothetical protein